MTEDVYAPPAARVEDVEDMRALGREFYVVAPRKFILLYLLTLQLYGIYWFYRNWSQHKARRRLSIWPVPRSIFAIFFVHSLFGEIDRSLALNGRKHAWNARTQATVYVLLAIAAYIIDRVGIFSSPTLDLALTIPATVLPVFPLLAAQRAINAAEGDEGGTSNAALSAANFAWMIAGGTFWALILFALTATIVDPGLFG